MGNILVPIDGWQNTPRIVGRAIELYRQAEAAVHLLSVQPPFNSHVAMFFSPAEIRKFHHEEGMREMAPAQDLLRKANVPFASHVEVGPHADTISRIARELGCRHIVMQNHPSGILSRLVLGSLASQVQHLMAGNATVCDVM